MIDQDTGLLIILFELTLILLVILLIVAWVIFHRHRRDRKLALQLVERLKEHHALRMEKLSHLLRENFEIDNNQAQAKAKNLLQCEKILYSHVLDMFMGHDRENILQLEEDVENLVKGYRYLLEPQTHEQHEPSHESLLVKLRKENQQLREDKKALSMNLSSSMQTLENIMAEYTSMYEGGRKEGEQRLKNEMFKLQQKISKVVADDAAVPELDVESDPDTRSG